MRRVHRLDDPLQRPWQGLLLRLLWGLLLGLLQSRDAAAHQSSVVYGDVVAQGRTVDVTLQIAHSDLYEALGLDKDRPASTAEAEAGAERIGRYVQARLSVENHGHPCAGTAEQHALLPKQSGDGFFFVQRLRFRCHRSLEDARLTYSLFFDVDPRHQCLLRLRSDGESGPVETEQVFRSSSRSLPLGRPLSTWDNLRDYSALGVEHIFTGYDHLAFLFALLIIAAAAAASGSGATGDGASPARDPADSPAAAASASRSPMSANGARRGLLAVVRIVTAFTLAHSVTLCLSGLGIVSLPGRLVESFIAASIGYVAIENLLRPVPRHRFLLTFAFGLVHGFGFASVLKEIGLPRRGLLLSLLSFNVGVELGQLVVVALAFPVLYLLAQHGGAQRRPFRPLSLLLLSVLLGLCALLFARFDLPIVPIAAVAFVLPAALVYAVPKLGYDRCVRVGVSSLLAVLSLLWLVERVSERTFFSGLLG